MLRRLHQNGKGHAYYLIVAVYICGGSAATIVSVVFGFNREHIGIALLLGAVVPLMLQKWGRPRTMERENRSENSARIRRICVLGWLTSIALSLIVLRQSDPYVISNEYFVTMTLGVLAIAAQILFDENRSKNAARLIVAEILVTSFALTCAYSTLYPGPYGNDALYHVGFIEYILQTGHTDGYGGYYVEHPLYHALLAMTEIAPNIALRSAHMWAGFVQVVCLLPVYVITRCIFGERAGLVGLLLASFCAHILAPRVAYFPSSFSIVFFSIAFSVAVVHMSSRSPSHRAIIVITFIAALLTHPLAPLVFAVVMMTMILTFRYCRVHYVCVRGNSVITMLLLVFFSWMTPTREGDTILGNIVNSARFAFEDFSVTGVRRSTLSPTLPLADVTLYDMGLTLLIFMAVAGSFTIIMMERNRRNASTSISSALAILALWRTGCTNRVWFFKELELENYISLPWMTYHIFHYNDFSLRSGGNIYGDRREDQRNIEEATRNRRSI